VFFSYKAVNSSVVSTSICALPRLPNLQDQHFLTLRWRSFYDGVTKISCTIMAEKVTITSHMNLGHPVTSRLSKMQDQKSLMLHWHSFSGWGMECVSLVVRTEGCQCFIYVDFWPVATLMGQDGKPEIVDAGLMQIFWMGQWLCHVLICLQWLPMSRLCIILTRLIPNIPIYETNNRWRSVDAHFQDWAVTILLCFLPIMASTMLVKWISDEID